MCVYSEEHGTVAVAVAQAPGAAALAPQPVRLGLYLGAAPQGFTEPRPVCSQRMKVLSLHCALAPKGGLS